LTDAILSILTLIAALNIALITVTIAVYAISTSFLGSETRRALWRRDRRKAELEMKLKTLLSEKKKGIEIQTIEKEIEKYKKEISGLEVKLESLSLRGAVLYPCMCFVLALIFILIGIVTYLDYPIARLYLVALAFGWVFVGVWSLGKTLKSIEAAASKPLLPEFKVSYETYLKIEKCKVGELKILEVMVVNTGDDLAEDMELFIYFPEGFVLPPEGASSFGYLLQFQPPERRTYPNHMVAIFKLDLLHIDCYRVFYISVEVPKKEETYTIPVIIMERKIGRTQHELTLEVTQ